MQGSRKLSWLRQRAAHGGDGCKMGRSSGSSAREIAGHKLTVIKGFPAVLGASTAADEAMALETRWLTGQTRW